MTVGEITLVEQVPFQKNARLIVSQIITSTLESPGLRYPRVDAARRRRLQAIRRELERER